MLNRCGFAVPLTVGETLCAVLVWTSDTLLANPNHRPMSRPPSRRQPLTSDQCRPAESESVFRMSRSSEPRRASTGGRGGMNNTSKERGSFSHTISAVAVERRDCRPLLSLSR